MSDFPPGFSIGHWSDPAARTGCTVVLCPPGTVGGAEVRGNSPGSREIDVLESERTVREVHAVLLTGGSAFGLAAADGVMKYLEERGRGYATPYGRVPIVPSAVIYDLNEGSPSVRPTAESGFSACEAAGPGKSAGGQIGAGTGATVGKWAGMEYRVPSGLGCATLRVDDLQITALAVVNAVGDVVSEDGKILAGARGDDGRWLAAENPLRRFALGQAPLSPTTNTTLVVVMANARLSKVDANRVARRAHNGLARAIRPVHTSFDGDITFALGCGTLTVPVDLVAEAGAEATARAIRHAVGHPPS